MSAHIVGDILEGKYRIIRVIGEGGWGVVYEGENARTLKRVAIKVLRAHAGVTPEIRTRFEREAQAGGRIASDHIVQVFDLGNLPDGTHYMVMELLVGDDLGTRLRAAGQLEPVVAVKLFVQLLDGLGAAHRAGILHRDLKPENLFLVRTRTGEDFVKILDFGVSKFSAPGMTATRTGAVLGSPYYMAPEQARGLKNIDGRTDLYSVGAVLFECVTGRVPFDGENFNDLMFKIVLSPRPSPLYLRPDLDPTLASIIVKSIAADPRERFASAEEFRATLVSWLESQGAREPRLSAPEARPVAGSVQRGSSDWPDRSADSPGRSEAREGGGQWKSASPGAEKIAETPLSSSSPVRPEVRRRRRQIAAVMGSIALSVAALGVVARWGVGHGPVETPGVATATPVPVLESMVATPPAPAPAPAAPPPQVQVLTPAVSASSPPVPSASTAAVDPPTGPRPVTRPLSGPSSVGLSKVPATNPAPAAPSADALQRLPEPAPAAPAAPSQETSGLHEKIEGREIRTGL
jgi:eukaryotic-like serine/threonine-protein kinase